jgi:transcriptional regulator with XRE-family HTH domain
VATAARRLGIGWSRSAVAQIELGNRDLSARELLALPFILNEAAQLSHPNVESFTVRLDELLDLRPGERLELGHGLRLSPDQVSGWLGDTVPP